MNSLLVYQNQLLLEQLFEFVATISPVVYKKEIPTLLNASIGKHVRHILEFYCCLLRPESRDTYVCYDERKRDLKLELDPQFAATEIQIMVSILSKFRQEELMLKVCSWADEATFLQSSFARELLYLAEHTVHHMASIRFGMNLLQPEFVFPEHFGIAPSTIHNRMSEKIIR
jgi:uncharacterized damage-inducible protein DinB